jgi:AcrR family transcriptional regulator
LELLAELGYDRMTMDAIAARAHASKATIYRRWPDKPALVAAALDALDADVVAEIADTGSLRGDLLAALHASEDQADEHYLAIMGALLPAARHHPDLAQALRAHVADDELSAFATIVQRAIARGDLPAHADSELVHHVAEAMLSRRLFLGEPLDDPFLADLIERVLLPLLAQPLPDQEPPHGAI